jgi:diguanylate cyclase (GGDEF)-like protein
MNLHGHYDRIKIFNITGQIVFSDDIELIGETYPFTGDLAQSIQDGSIHAHLSDLSEAENLSERGLGRLIEVYVPLIPGDSEQIAGAYEVYIPYGDIAAAIWQQQRWVWGGVSTALFLLWVAMLWIFQRASNTIEKQHKLAMIDPLTEISNRRFLLQNLQLEVERYRRYRRSFSLIIADLDHFKKFNDILGHQAGDKVLRMVAEQMIQNTRGADVVARYGGEEFAILLPETGLGLAAWVAERVCEAVKMVSIDGRSVSVSMGVATYQGGNLEDLIRRADEALYRAKHFGRARVEISIHEPTQAVIENSVV